MISSNRAAGQRVGRIGSLALALRGQAHGASMIAPSHPKSLGDPAARRFRCEPLRSPSVAPLTEFVEFVRRERGLGREVPYFDPLDGGVNAKALFLLEAPGPKAVETGFVSRDNPDESAKNMFEVLQTAGLTRNDSVLWNIVPWYLGSGVKIRAAGQKDIDAGRPYLLHLLGLLTDLEIVALVGGAAHRVGGWLREELPNNVRIMKTPHPSPQFVNRRSENRERLKEAFSEVAKCYRGDAKRCEICSESIQRGKRCRRCGLAHDGFSADGRSDVAAITFAMQKSLRGGEFFCYYTGLRLDLGNSGSPFFRSIDHRTPGDRTDLVMCCMFVNQMKADLTEAEFRNAVIALAKGFTTGQPVDQSKLQFSKWTREWNG